MNKEKLSNIKLGLFVIISSFLLIFGIYNIGNKQNIFGSTFTISTVFKDGKGLKTGNNVRYAGINIGSIDDLKLLDDSTVQVVMVLEKDKQAYIKKDAVATIGSDGLVGNMIISISPGKGNLPTVVENDIIPSFTQLSTNDMMGQVGLVLGNVELLTANLLEVTEKINKGQGTMATLLNDESMGEQLKNTLTLLNNSAANIESLSLEFQKGMTDFNEGNGNLAFLLKDNSLEEQMEKIPAVLDSFMNTEIHPMMSSLNESSKQIELTTNALNSLINEIDPNEGLVGAILKDSTNVNEFEQILLNLNRGTENFNENMEALKSNFLLRKYFKKKAKKEKQIKQLG